MHYSNTLTIKPTLKLFSPKHQTSSDKFQKLQVSFAVIALVEIKVKLMRQIRYLDKLIDELAKGRAMEKVLRK